MDMANRYRLVTASALIEATLPHDVGAGLRLIARSGQEQRAEGLRRLFSRSPLPLVCNCVSGLTPANLWSARN